MPPADNRAHLLEAAARRSTDTRQRATQALRRLDKAGAPITFSAVADEADVSRSWLYRDADIRTEIEQLRHTRPRSRSTLPGSQRAIDPSLHQRLQTLLDDNRSLRDEVRQLREQIALLLGEQRAATTARPARAHVSDRAREHVHVSDMSPTQAPRSTRQTYRPLQRTTAMVAPVTRSSAHSHQLGAGRRRQVVVRRSGRASARWLSTREGQVGDPAW